MAPVFDDFQMLHDPGQLAGNQYMEVMAGPYRDRCWNHGSAYIKEEVFAYWELLIERHAPHFNHWAFTEVARDAWGLILRDLSALAGDLDSATTLDRVRDRLCFLFNSSETQLTDNFPHTARRLATLTREFVAWAEAQLRAHQSLTILGI
jgi:hypothetical protein